LSESEPEDEEEELFEIEYPNFNTKILKIAINLKEFEV